MLNNSTIPERMQPVNPFRAHLDALDQAGNQVQNFYQLDSQFPKLIQLMGLGPQCSPTYSGMSDIHYPGMHALAPGLLNIKELAIEKRVPLPPAVMEHFPRMQCNCMMGLFSEINRAWLTIDSDIYIWAYDSYENEVDLAYFDGLGEAILSVALVKPKPNIFYQYIKYLIVLTTTVEIVVLGVRFLASKPEGPLGGFEEMHLLPEPIFVVPTDGVAITCIASSANGRIFLGGRDGSLFEIDYKVERTWLGKRFSKINHSTRLLSYIVPSFISSRLTEDDPIVKISIDNSRNILYTLTERGTVEVWDLGESGCDTSRVTSVSQHNIVAAAVNIVKTLEPKCFRPIIHISALEISDSEFLNLLAVSQTGARFYFTTSMSYQANARPSMLVLQHVRMPPGFAANSPSYRPANASMSVYGQGNLVLIVSPGEQDAVWSLSSDLFPFQANIMECQTIIPLEAKVWAISEIKENNVLFSKNVKEEQPPLVVRQHRVPPKKYIVLTAQGTLILVKHRPVDILRQIMQESRGPESEAVKSFFMIQKEEQACATALILACSESQQNIKISEWATRAFFLYGGEPRSRDPVGVPPPTPTSPLQYAFNPAVASTPQSIGVPSPAADTSSNPPDRFSAKHNGVFIFVSRILRPIWRENVAVKLMTPSKQEFLESAVSNEECVWILQHLHSVKSFLEKNSQFTANSLHSTNLKRDTYQTPGRQRPLQVDASIEEKNGLLNLKIFVQHCCEVIGLWNILCEHQFHLIGEMLDKEIQMYLPSFPFNELIMKGHQLCSLFINALINSYLGDNASVDSISNRLRTVCPSLFKNEDAACTKANEMLRSAKISIHIDEKEAKLKQALQICKDVAPNIELTLICRQFAANQFYLGILELCVCCAEKHDPKNIALHWYRNKEPVEDVQGYEAYSKRMDCYKQITLVLDQLYNLSLSAPSIPTNIVAPFTSDVPISPKDAEFEAKRLLQLALQSDDDLLHIAVYEWMMAKDLHGELISIPNSSLEQFLTRSAERTNSSVQVSDLLWKYYEKNQNHASAAKVLHMLASKKGPVLTLPQRIGYLARAVMCMRSDKVGSAPHLGVFLQELEDKMEIAAIQQQILDAIKNLRCYNSEIIESSISRLNGELFNCTALYEDFAEPFELWECKLAIIQSTNHNNPQLVEEIWQNIIDIELKKFQGRSPSDKMSGLLNKITELTQEYGNNVRCFPLLFIVRTLETLSCRLGVELNEVFLALLNAGLPYNKLLEAYHSIYNTNDRTWALEGNEFHVIETIAELCCYFADNPMLVPGPEKRIAVTKSQDVISSCLLSLYAKTGTQDLIARLKGVESKLKRMEGL